MATGAPVTKARIINAADDLFYAEGLAAVSMDRIAARAGVTKKTLYYHFRSKDDLMGAYLEARRGPVLKRYQGWAGTTGSVAERMERMFRNLGQAAADRSWQGCGFLRAACELAHLPGHPASVAARRHKAEFEAWMRSMLDEEGHPGSEKLARALMILLDGAIIQTLIHRSRAYAEAAAQAAAALLARQDAGDPDGCECARTSVLAGRGGEQVHA
jgi:AcrR family transcriptional regulator